jgi:hypothetical protein
MRSFLQVCGLKGILLILADNFIKLKTQQNYRNKLKIKEQIKLYTFKG